MSTILNRLSLATHYLGGSFHLMGVKVLEIRETVCEQEENDTDITSGISQETESVFAEFASFVTTRFNRQM